MLPAANNINMSNVPTPDSGTEGGGDGGEGSPGGGGIDGGGKGGEGSPGGEGGEGGDSIIEFTFTGKVEYW